jgi:tetratricopeptide (TPR) repeat protein
MPATEPLEIFYSYAHEDERLRDELEKHLSGLKRQGFITDWHDRDITAGSEWKDAIDDHLESAHIILLLISPDFLASDYCHDVEMTRALERQEKNEARVIPIILRPVDWDGVPFSKLQCLPKNAEPVTLWKNEDAAFMDIAKGIRKAAAEIRNGPPHPDPLPQGEGITSPARLVLPLPPGEGGGEGIVSKIWNWLTETNMKKLAFIGVPIAFLLTWGWPIYVHFFPPETPKPLAADAVTEHIDKGNRLLNIGRYADAKAAFQQALTSNPQDQQAAWGLRKASAWDLSGAAFEQEIRDLREKNSEDPHVDLLWGNFYATDHQPQEAIPYLEKAIKLNPSLAEAHFTLGVLYDQQDRWDEAKAEYVKAAEVSQSTPKYRNNLAYFYFKQGDYGKAIEEYGKISEYPLSALELARIYWLRGELKQARDIQAQAIGWLNDERVMTKAENQDPWYFEVGKEGIEFYDLEEKKAYAFYSLCATFFLLGQDQEARAFADKARALGVAHEANVTEVLSFDLGNLARKNTGLAKQIDTFQERWLK